MDLKEIGGVVWIGFTVSGPGQGQVAGYCELGYELLGSLIYGELLE